MKVYRFTERDVRLSVIQQAQALGMRFAAYCRLKDRLDEPGDVFWLTWAELLAIRSRDMREARI